MTSREIAQRIQLHDVLRELIKGRLSHFDADGIIRNRIMGRDDPRMRMKNPHVTENAR